MMEPNQRCVPTDRHVLLLSALTEPPRDPLVRDDFVRQSLIRLCVRRGYDRIAAVLRACDDLRLRSIILVINNLDALDQWDESKRSGGYRDREIKVVAKDIHPEKADPTFLRIVELASNVVSWENEENGEYEFDEYIRPAWLVFTDEVEFELEGLDIDEDAFLMPPRRRPHTRKELLDMAKQDARA